MMTSSLVGQIMLGKSFVFKVAGVSHGMEDLDGKSFKLIGDPKVFMSKAFKTFTSGGFVQAMGVRFDFKELNLKWLKATDPPEDFCVLQEAFNKYLKLRNFI